MKSVYELKKLTVSNRAELIDALRLYLEYTEPAVRTDTKEIMYCVNNWNDLYEDPFYVFGFYFNGTLIGFAELAYFSQEKFVIVDYLVIHQSYRKNNTFYQFLEDLRLFLQKENLEYSYIVAEVACYHENLEPPESSKLLIRLLKIAHFGVVKCNYYVPRVGMNDYESEMRSIMMIYSLNEVKQIKKETFFQIVNAIYFKYYQRWHNLFADEEEIKRYNSELEELIIRMKKQLDNKKTIELNGLTGLFPVNTNFDSNVKGKKALKLLTGVLLFLVCFILVAFSFTMIKSKLGWDSETLIAIVTISGGLTLFVLALFFENKSNLFSKIFEKMLD